MKVKIKNYFRELSDLTVGKIYEVTYKFSDGDIGIKDDVGFLFITRPDEPCAFLNGGEWEVVDD